MPYCFKTGIFTVMDDLQRSMAAVLPAHIRVPGHGQDCPVLIHVQLEGFVLALCDVNGAVSGIQGTDAAAGKHAEPVHEIVSDQAVFAGQIRGGRRQGDAVFKIDAADADRLENM